MYNKIIIIAFVATLLAIAINNAPLVAFLAIFWLVMVIFKIAELIVDLRAYYKRKSTLKKLDDSVTQMIDNEKRKKEQEVFKRDRAVKDTKTEKRILKVGKTAKKNENTN